MPFADLHCHSTASDGAFPPAEVVRRAHELGLAISLTDHDSLAGQAEAQTSAALLGVPYLTGIEFSCRLEGLARPLEVHLLGYGMPADDPAITQYSRDLLDMRHQRAEEICAKLAALGCVLDCEKLMAARRGRHIGRPHVADAMVAAGFVESKQEAFDNYLHNQGPAYVPYGKPLDLYRAIELITAAGGIAVVAHPGQYGLQVIDQALPAMIECGLQGIEIDHPRNDEAIRLHYGALAEKLGLITTGGSDWHGGTSKHESPLGSHGVAEELFREILMKPQKSAFVPKICV